MPGDKKEVLLLGPLKPVVMNGLERACIVHKTHAAKDPEAFFADHADIRAIACSATTERIPGSFMERFPNLEIVASFGVGYDHMDSKWAAAHGVILTNTPGVLTEEVADTALGLLLCTVRELPQAERYLRAGKWPGGDYPLTKATLRERTVGLVGMGAIGQAIARRLEAFGVTVVYHTRQKRSAVPYRHYPNLVDMARGSVVDEAALIKALQDKRIHSAGLDVYAKEPQVPAELIAMDNVVLFPHLGSASVHTRAKMDQLMVDNILAWAAGKPPLTPVAETPWRSWSKVAS